MLKLYQGFRIFILSVSALLVILISTFSLAISTNAEWFQPVRKTTFYTNYSVFHATMLYDPYTEKTLNSKNMHVAILTNVLNDRVVSLENFSKDKVFNEQLFSFYISQKIDDIKSLAEKYFLTYADFRDLVIIDKQKNLIFKYGIENFSVQYYEISNVIDGLFFDNHLALILKSDDPTLEYEYEIIALFDTTEFNAVLQEMDVPAFVFLKDRLMRTQQFPRSLFKNIQGELTSLKKKRFGMRILEIHPLHVSQKVMGYSGILYPVRSVGSYLIFILKLALIGLIIVIVYVLDRWIYAAINDKQIIKEETRAFKQENGLDDEEEEGVTKSNLDWIENYIEESEVKRK